MLKNENRIFQIATAGDFQALSLEIFRIQYESNPIYRRWVDQIRVDVKEVRSEYEIPFLPIEFFKGFKVITGEETGAEDIFLSSSTTSSVPARHYVKDMRLYESSFLNTFRLFYGDPAEYCFLALLPSYLQRSSSSLVYMCQELIRQSPHPYSGFFLDEIDDLITKINELKQSKTRVLLIGVSYALMDLADKGIRLSDNFTVMETGGMKGRRKELLKPELHTYLRERFLVRNIHSEYGMTELLSQAYSRGDGLFSAPPWLKFLTREIDDPLQLRRDSRTGGINVIDLANINSCSFIATKDLGRIHADGRLELLGRYNESDVRGCNLMIENF